jgi:hypothetical protein
VDNWRAAASKPSSKPLTRNASMKSGSAIPLATVIQMLPKKPAATFSRNDLPTAESEALGDGGSAMPEHERRTAKRNLDSRLPPLDPRTPALGAPRAEERPDRNIGSVIRPMKIRLQGNWFSENPGLPTPFWQIACAPSGPLHPPPFPARRASALLHLPAETKPIGSGLRAEAYRKMR